MIKQALLFVAILSCLGTAIAKAQSDPPPSYIIETSTKNQTGTGRFEGPVDNITSVGLHWYGDFHDNTNHQVRKLDIQVDSQDQNMTIIESGGGYGDQVWEGQYKVQNDFYKMSGTCIKDNGQVVTNKYNISANLYLPF